LQAAIATANEIQIKMYFFIVENLSFKKIETIMVLKKAGVLSGVIKDLRM
jgi:hypothetical protein